MATLRRRDLSRPASARFASRFRQTATARKGEANVPDSEPRHQSGGVRALAASGSSSDAGGFGHARSHPSSSKAGASAASTQRLTGPRLRRWWRGCLVTARSNSSKGRHYPGRAVSGRWLARSMCAPFCVRLSRYAFSVRGVFASSGAAGASQPTKRKGRRKIDADLGLGSHHCLDRVSPRRLHLPPTTVGSLSLSLSPGASLTDQGAPRVYG